MIVKLFELACGQIKALVFSSPDSVGLPVFLLRGVFRSCWMLAVAAIVAATAIPESGAKKKNIIHNLTCSSCKDSPWSNGTGTHD